VAKNVVLVVGDGMSLATITAARILRGQQLGMSGEEHQLAFEKFPHLALAKVRNIFLGSKKLTYDIFLESFLLT